MESMETWEEMRAKRCQAHTKYWGGLCENFKMVGGRFCRSHIKESSRGEPDQWNVLVQKTTYNTRRNLYDKIFGDPTFFHRLSAKLHGKREGPNG